MPQTDGQTSLESGRHTLCTLGQVFYGNRGLDVTLFQRFGAIQMAIVCSKTIASPFRGDVNAFLPLSELIWEPLAYLETKIQHQKSNNKRKTPGGPRNNTGNDGGDDAPGAGDNGDGSSSAAMGKNDDLLPVAAAAVRNSKSTKTRLWVPGWRRKFHSPPSGQSTTIFHSPTKLMTFGSFITQIYTNLRLPPASAFASGGQTSQTQPVAGFPVATLDAAACTVRQTSPCCTQP